MKKTFAILPSRKAFIGMYVNRKDPNHDTYSSQATHILRVSMEIPPMSLKALSFLKAFDKEEEVVEKKPLGINTPLLLVSEKWGSNPDSLIRCLWL